MMRAYAHRITIWGMVISAMSAIASPREAIQNINGYEVHFVDLGVGDAAGVVFASPFGALHDSGKQMGALHLLEHMLFKGSIGLPGEESYKSTIHRAHASSNGYTSANQTYYYAYGPAQNILSLLKAHLSMALGLEWLDKPFERERRIVANEIADEDNTKDTMAFESMNFYRLLAPEHPWAHPLYGDRASLEALTIDDLKALYTRSYHPKVVKIAVIGNFSDASLLEQTESWLKNNLRATEPATPVPRADVPTLFSQERMAPESLRRLYIESDSLKESQMVMELNHVDPVALAVLCSYLNLQEEGSIHFRLIEDLNWATSVQFHQTHFNNHSHLIFSAALTPAGLQHTEDINRLVFLTLHSIAQNGILPEALSKIKKLDRLDLEDQSHSVEAWIEFYASILLESESIDSWLQRLDRLSAADLQAMAHQVRPDRTLYVEMGPLLPNMTWDPIFHRHYKRIDNHDTVNAFLRIQQKPIAALFQPRFTSVELPASSAMPFQPFFETTKPQIDLTEPIKQSEQWALHFRKDLPDAAAAVDFSLPAFSPQQMVAIDVVFNAFYTKFRNELSDILTRYETTVSFRRQRNHLFIQAHGPSRIAAKALIWTLQKLNQFQPSVRSIQKALHQYVDDERGWVAGQFSAYIAEAEVKADIDPLNIFALTASETAKTMLPEQVMQIWSDLKRQSGKDYALVGPFVRSDFEEIRQAAHEFSPVNQIPLRPTAAAPAINPNRFFSLQRGSDRYAAVRFYRGPKLTEYHQVAALTALNLALTYEVTELNRAQQALGYVHESITSSVDHKHLYLHFVGQTNSSDNLERTILGWEKVLNQIYTGEISAAALNVGLAQLQSNLSEKATTATDLLSVYIHSLELYGDAKARQKILRELATLTAFDLIETAAKYLSASHITYHQAAFSPCEHFLATTEIQ